MPHFARRDARRHAWASSRGWLSPVERKNGWQWAAVHGDATPDGLQPLLGRASWEAAAVREALRTSLVESMGDPPAVLVLDETGLLQQGQQSAGVARQDSGPAGRLENGQMGVLLASASRQRHALLAGALSMPPAWTHDRARCQRAGLPAQHPLATQPQGARQRLQRACDARVPAAWVPGESVYGHDRPRRMWLEAHERAHVLAVSGKAEVWRAGQQPQGKTLLATVATEAWDRLSAGDGAKGPRWYDWTWLPLAAPVQPAWRRWLLVRRRLSDPTALTAYVVCAPQATALATLVPVAGSRGSSEQGFEEAKGEVGLEHDAGRRGTGWDRHITLAMWA